MTKYFYLHLFIFIFLFLFAPRFLFAGHDGKKHEKQFPSFFMNTIVVDGKADEWPANQFLFNKDADLAYSISNDSANIFVCFKIHSQEEQMKLLKGGAEVWFNPTGKKKKTTCLHFPLGNSLPPINRNASPGERPDIKKMKLMILLKLNQLELIGFKDEDNGYQNNKKNKTGIMAIIDWDSVGNMIYEAKIPLNAFKEEVKSANPLMVGIIVKAPEKTAQRPGDTEGAEFNDHQMGQMGGNRERGQGNPMGGHEGRGFSSRGGNEHMFEDDVIWNECGIAHQN